MKNLFFFLSFFLIISCSNEKGQNQNGEEPNPPQGHNHEHGKANEHMHKTDFSALVKRFESEERTAYQKPDEVMAYLGDVSGQTVMEIGAGTGYFSFRLVDSGAKVIAADVDERFQEYIKNKRDSLGISEDQLSLRQVPYDNPQLKDKEVDMVLVVNTYHHIDDREKYFQKVYKGLKEGGRLVVIDFFKKDLPVGPPVDMKLTADDVGAELSAAGFSQFEVNGELLDYQYIVVATKR